MLNYDRIKEICQKDDVFSPTTNIVKLAIFLTGVTEEKSYTRVQEWLEEKSA